MKIEIKKIIIQEGLLDFIKENKGKLGLLAGAGAGIGLHNNYMNSGAKSIGEYTGTKFDQASNHLKNGYDTAKSGITNTYNDIKDLYIDIYNNVYNFCRNCTKKQQRNL